MRYSSFLSLLSAPIFGLLLQGASAALVKDLPGPPQRRGSTSITLDDVSMAATLGSIEGSSTYSSPSHPANATLDKLALNATFVELSLNTEELLDEICRSDNETLTDYYTTLVDYDGLWVPA